MDAPPPPTGSKPRLLIVDDVADNRDLLCRRFQRRGFDTVEADCGVKALELIREQAFDLVLLDIEMPEMDGLEVLRRIRRQHSATDLPVIMVTGRAHKADVMAAVSGAANGYVTKPVNFDLALARVEALLKTRGQAATEEEGGADFFTFRDVANSIPPYPVVGLAAEELVTPIVSPEILADKLGGCARYLDDKGRAYLGVWGDKNVERFHALLASKTPKLVTRQEKPPTARLEWRRSATAAKPPGAPSAQDPVKADAGAA